MIKLKAFIYRFSCIFGLRIYLAQKEENAYISAQGKMSQLSESITRGAWQASQGFTSVWTYRMSFREAMLAKIRHAFGR